MSPSRVQNTPSTTENGHSSSSDEEIDVESEDFKNKYKIFEREMRLLDERERECGNNLDLLKKWWIEEINKVTNETRRNSLREKIEKALLEAQMGTLTEDPLTSTEKIPKK